jgi:hypothetical protein
MSIIYPNILHTSTDDGLYSGFVLSSALFILGVAAVSICVTILATILFACTFLPLRYTFINPDILIASILLPILFFTSLLSLSILTFLLSLFLLHRLYIHLTTQPDQTYNSLSKGIKGWAEETAGRVPSVQSAGWKGSNGTAERVISIKNEGLGKVEVDVPAGMRIRSINNDVAPGINF